MSTATFASNTQLQNSNEKELLEILSGLSEVQKKISPKFFYDKKGSELFNQICDLKEYYPTRTEIGILKKHINEISYLVGEESHIIEYGAGSSRKIKILLKGLQRPLAYTPIDISQEYLHQSCLELSESFPEIKILPVYADFLGKVEVPFINELWKSAKRVLFFPGSTVGNFDPPQAISLLKRMRSNCYGGGLLIGVDLVKDVDILNNAYNDSLGITANFNLNILRRINREFQANFDLNQFEHRAFFNTQYSRIEMHLQSLTHQVVNIGGKAIKFEKNETIHTENSYKYTVDSFYGLAQKAGFIPIKTWMDSKKLFSVHYLIDSQKVSLFDYC